MAEHLLHLTVRTPHAIVLEDGFDSLRIPAGSGQVGLRPRAEASLLVVETGLVVARRGTRVRFLATAGGLLRHRGTEATLLTPIAVVGENAREVLQAMERAQAGPDEEQEVRHQLSRLEQHLREELRGRRVAAPGPAGRET